jgi:hypothetical protein
VQSTRKIGDATIKQTNPVQPPPLFQFLDERVSFAYNNSLRFEKNDSRFDALLSLLDYYAYMVLGYDEDTYFVKGGTAALSESAGYLQ